MPSMSGPLPNTAELPSARALFPPASSARPVVWRIVPFGSVARAAAVYTTETVRLPPAGIVPRLHATSRPTMHPFSAVPASEIAWQLDTPLGICVRTSTPAASRTVVRRCDDELVLRGLPATTPPPV